MFGKPNQAINAQRLQRVRGADVQAGFGETQGWRDDHEDSHIMLPAWVTSTVASSVEGTAVCTSDSETKKETSFFAIFDGHNGKSAADFVSEYLPKTLRNAHLQQQATTVGSPSTTSGLSMLRNEVIDQVCIDCDEAYRKQRINRAGCTACMVFTERISEDSVGEESDHEGKEKEKAKYLVRFANIGDSRAILVSYSFLPATNPSSDVAKIPSFEIKMFTRDHKPSDPDELARITAAGYTVSADGRLMGQMSLSRSFGDFLLKQNKTLAPKDQPVTCVPEHYQSISSLETSSSVCSVATPSRSVAQEGDFIILACDGLFEVSSNEDICAMIGERLQLQLDEMFANSSSTEFDLARVCSEVVKLSLVGVMREKQDGSGELVEQHSEDNMSLCLIYLNRQKQGTAENETEGNKRQEELLVGNYFDYVPVSSLSLEDLTLSDENGDSREGDAEARNALKQQVKHRRMFEAFFERVNFGDAFPRYIDPEKAREKRERKLEKAREKAEKEANNQGKPPGKQQQGKGKKGRSNKTEEELEQERLAEEAKERERRMLEENVEKRRHCRCHRVWREPSTFAGVHLCACCL